LSRSFGKSGVARTEICRFESLEVGRPLGAMYVADLLEEGLGRRTLGAKDDRSFADRGTNTWEDLIGMSEQRSDQLGDGITFDEVCRRKDVSTIGTHDWHAGNARVALDGAGHGAKRADPDDRAVEAERETLGRREANPEARETARPNADSDQRNLAAGYTGVPERGFDVAE
jgi:hypothetical protein